MLSIVACPSNRAACHLAVKTCQTIWESLSRGPYVKSRTAKAGSLHGTSLCSSHRMEYALKRSGRFLLKGNADEAKPAWDAFGSDHDSDFNRDTSPELKRAVAYFTTTPPRKQIVIDGTLSWSEFKTYDGSGALLKWLLTMVRRVRNNLFHGAKFPSGPMPDPSRDQELLWNAMVILQAALSLDRDLERIFSEEIDV